MRHEFHNITDYPETVEEAANKLLAILTNAERQQVKTMTKDELALLYFSFGRDIRNAFGLNTSNTELLANRHEDDVSMDIIETLWKRIQTVKSIPHSGD